jgi:menaquinone-dependent protoporphyrinogen IX oxidase
MGPIENTEKQFADARRHLDNTLLKLQGVTPKEVAIFGGVLQPAKLKFPHTGMKSMPPADLRDWSVIEAWAESLPANLGLEVG